jgi:micrococcal nuclease
MERVKVRPTASIFTIMLLTSIPIIFLSSIQTDTQKEDSNCDSSYPDICIAPYPPDLNCDDIQNKNFEVLPPDPHGFDREEDGIGCET